MRALNDSARSRAVPIKTQGACAGHWRLARARGSNPRRVLAHGHLAAIVAFVYISPVILAQEKDVHTLVAEANLALAEGDYATALDMYRAAEVTCPGSPELAYNRGVANYMLGDYAQAHDAFNRSLLTRDVGLEAKIKFNLGNVAYAAALKKMSSPPEALGLLKSAIAHYRDALELDSEDEDARVNIELAQRLIRDLLDKLKEQRKEGQQQEDQQKQQDDKDQQQGGQSGEQPEDGAEQQPEQPQSQAGDRMTPQEMERLLQAVRDKERQRQNERARRRQRVPRTPVAKDW